MCYEEFWHSSRSAIPALFGDMELAVTVHGFRSAFRDWVAEKTDYPGEVAEAALAHAIPNKVEAAYRRTDFLEKRKILVVGWAAFCSGQADRH